MKARAEALAAFEKMQAASEANITKIVDFSNDYQLKQEIKADDEKVKAAAKELKEKEKLVKDEERQAQELDRMWAEAEKKKYATFKHYENQIAGEVGRTTAQSLIEGKSLGAGMKQVAVTMAEDMISALIEWGIQDLLTKTLMKGSAATLAGANMTASFAAAPWPIDMGAPAAGASAMVSAMAFEYGGEIPGSGAVPIMAHGGETVVTKALTDQVKGNRSGGGGGHTVHVTQHIHTMDAEGFERVLAKNASAVQRHVTSTLRKMNQS